MSVKNVQIFEKNKKASDVRSLKHFKHEDKSVQSISSHISSHIGHLKN